MKLLFNTRILISFYATIVLAWIVSALETALVSPFLILLWIPSDPNAGQIALLSVLLVLIGICTAAIFPLISGESSNFTTEFESQRPGCLGKGKGYGKAYSIFNIAYSLGSFICPFAAGGAVSHSGWGIVVLSLGISAFGTAFIIFPFIGGNLFVTRRKKRQEMEGTNVDFVDDIEVAEKNKNSNRNRPTNEPV